MGNLRPSGGMQKNIIQNGSFKMVAKVLKIFIQYLLFGHNVGKSEKKNLILLTKFTFI